MVPAALSDNNEAHAAGTEESVLVNDPAIAEKVATDLTPTQVPAGFTWLDESNIGGMPSDGEITAACPVIVLEMS
jgi:hypothetical protein